MDRETHTGAPGNKDDAVRAARPMPGVAPTARVIPSPRRARRGRVRRLVDVSLVVALVATVGLGVVTVFGRSSSSKFSSVGSAICDSTLTREPLVPSGAGVMAGVVPAVGWSVGGGRGSETAAGCGDPGTFNSSPAGGSPAVASAAPAPAPGGPAANAPAAAAGTPAEPSFGVKALDPAVAPASAAAGHAFVSTATMTVRVGDKEPDETKKQTLVADAKEQAILLVEAAGGGLFGEQSTFDGQARATVTLKVPPASFRSMLSGLGKLGFVQANEVKTDDITDQVIDLAARIAAAQHGLDRTRGLLDKAANLTEVNSLENEVSRRETEVETLLGQQKTLSQRVDLATIIFTVVGAPAPVVVVTAPTTAVPAPIEAKPLPGFNDGLQGGWKVFTVVGTVLLAALGAALPFLPFLVVAAVAWRVHRRRVGAATRAAPVAPAA